MNWMLQAQLSLGEIATAIGLFISVATILVTVGYFKGRFEGLEKSVKEMRDEKKKVDEAQQTRNLDYHTRLTSLEGIMKTLMADMSEMKADIKKILTRST